MLAMLGQIIVTLTSAGSTSQVLAAYYGYPSGGWGGVSSKDYEMYIKNLHDSGYNPKNNFTAVGNIQG